MAPARSIRAVTAVAVYASLVAGCATSPPPKAPEIGDDRNTSALTVVAEIALERGDCRTAAENYVTAARHGSAELARRASEVALACEHLPAAFEASKRWRSFDLNDRNAATIHATVALKLHRIDEARSALQAATQVSGESAEKDLIVLIQLLSEEVDASAALVALDGTPAARSSSPLVLAALGQLALQAYDLKRAERFAREAIKHDPKSVPPQKLLGRISALQGDSAGAIAAAKNVMRLDAEAGKFELAEILVALDRIEEARQELERVRASGSADPGEVDRRLALLAFETGDFSEAQRRFADLVSRGHAGEAALFYLADIAAREGDKDTALEGYRQLIDSSLAVAARTRAASLLLDRSERAEALQLLDAYAAEHPESTFELMLAKAHLLAEHGDHDGGLAMLSAALEKHPQHPGIEYERAVMLERAGRVSDAVKALEALLASRPDDPTLLNALGYTLADHNLELPRAESLIRRSLESMPDSPAALDSLGWVRLRRGDTRNAIPALERAYTIGRDAEIAAHWGEALWISGKQQEARKVWAAALARNPDSEPLKETLKRLLPPEQP